MQRWRQVTFFAQFLHLFGAMGWLQVLEWTALIATIMATALTGIHFSRFLLSKTDKYAMKQVCRILLLVPIQAIAGAFAIYGYSWRRFLDIFRDGYQGYAIYCFFLLIVHYLGGEEKCIQHICRQDKLTWLFPFNILYRNKRATRGSYFLVKSSILQFFFVALAMCLFALVPHETTHPVGTQQSTWVTVWFVVEVLVNASMCLSMMGLVQFYFLLKAPLQGYQPLSKFMAIKFVVFFAFYQDLLLELLADLGAIPSVDGLHPVVVAHRLQECLCCVEMVLAAVLHIVIFPIYTPTSLAKHLDTDPAAFEDPEGIRKQLGLKGKNQPPQGTTDRRQMNPALEADGDTSLLEDALAIIIPVEDLVDETKALFRAFKGEGKHEKTRLAADLEQPPLPPGEHEGVLFGGQTSDDNIFGRSYVDDDEEDTLLK